MNPDNNNRLQWRLNPMDARAVMGLVAALLGLFAIQFGNFNGFQLGLLVVFFAAGILGKRAWAIYLMLATFIGLKYFILEPNFNWRFYQLRFGDFILALVLILLVATCFRYLEFSRYLNAFYPDVKGGKDALPQKLEFPSLLGGRWWVIPVAVCVATVMLSIFPAEKQLYAPLNLEARVSRLMFLTLFLFFSWFVCRSVIGTVIRWRMERSQAEVQCRSLIAKELWKDVYPIEHRRARDRARE